MANTEKQVAKLMAQEIVHAIKSMNEDNNRSYVDNQLKHYTSSASQFANSAGTATTITGTIDPSQVDGLYGVIADYIFNASDNATLGDEDAGKIISTITGLAAIEVKHATIETAQIENLYGSYAEFIDLVAKDADIGNLDVEQVRADIADIGLANIGTAKINWAQMEMTDSDVILSREQLTGKLTVEYLNVIEANMVNLTVGELLLKGTDGKFNRIVVDEDGNVYGEAVTDVDGSFINDNTLSGTKIIENSITAREIAAGSITANEILANTITASQIASSSITSACLNTGEIFGNDGVLRLIAQSETVGTGLDLSKNSSITMTNEKIDMVVSSESNSTTLVLTDKMLEAITGHVNIIADEIDLSANKSIKLSVKETVVEQIGYRMEIVSTSDILSSAITQTTLTAKVYQGKDDITDQIPASRFKWKRVSSDSTGDMVWNNNHAGKKSITLTTLDVYYSATYQCELEE